MARIAPSGYFFALHIRKTLPLLREQTFPESWVEVYEREVYAVRDPIVAWGFSRTGVIRWSELDLPDPFDILGQARAHGLAFGASAAWGPISSRSIASIARSDREFTAEEIGTLAETLRRMHDVTEPPKALTDAQIEALRCIAEGDRYAAAAAKLAISESALKARLRSARESLKARTTTEAVRLAQGLQLV
ncbi:autoinducer binding domain-containing protein [Histidinibacterium aquaticum]|uniref:autoinducer binding domain-containing protein n=1 Tax=Histidinibacterium aquaticum TaxID=2613962 RepID=UPI00295EDB58|nr:autoinducer binding domain-containing protein [Histidinibacterium aquaticum]